jgi:hypothetical protein
MINAYRSLQKTSLFGLAAICLALAPAALACPGQNNGARLNTLRSLPHGLQLSSGQGGGDIVGLWEVDMTVVGLGLYDHAFQQLFRDGNEIQNSGLVPPAAGAICFGRWTQVNGKTLQLKHFGWTFDLAGNYTGKFILTATITLSGADSYTGTFIADIELPNGNLDPNAHVEGTITGQRIASN